MKIPSLKTNLMRISFVLGLASILLWACGNGSETKEEPAAAETEVAPVPEVTADTTAVVDTTTVDTSAGQKDPVPIRTPPVRK